MKIEHLKDAEFLTVDKATHHKCKCGKTHKMSGYPIAQLAQGHALTHTCTCGVKSYLSPQVYDTFIGRERN